MNTQFADKTEMQNRLFAKLSHMFGREVPLYDKSLAVNKECNKTVCALLRRIYPGFELNDEQLDKTSGERHGAIRIGRRDEYRLITKFFAAFGMEPHNYYDMTNVGAKSQPIVATAFRSRLNPEHRIFCSLLMTDYFDLETRERIENLLAQRQVFSKSAIALVEKNERDGGLNSEDAAALIDEGIMRIFKWTGRARDFQLYEDLSKAGFKIAADIACFESHHLNHLTPNTFCMDLYTTAMKFCLGEMDATTFLTRATSALESLIEFGDRDFLRLHFKHLSWDSILALPQALVSSCETSALASTLLLALKKPQFDFSNLRHSGFKDFTEGPSNDTPVLLRQDAYRALTEPVTFVQSDGSTIETVHTARFGEIEQRFYATTLKGRELYDQCLTAAESLREGNRDFIKKDFEGYLNAYRECFRPFPKRLLQLLEQNFVYGRFGATDAGRRAAKQGIITTSDLFQLIHLGYAKAEGLRYEDFLPISAAGIFASNLGQYGTKSSATTKPIYKQAMLEEIMGRSVVDSHATYALLEAESIRTLYQDLNIVNLSAKENLAPPSVSH